MSEEDNQSPGFLQRWSKRKTEQVQTPPVVAVPDENGTEQAGTELSVENNEGAAELQQVEESHLTDADMPAVETLNGDSDYSPFLSEGVSKELRNIALKKLFFSGRFGIRDGLDDYDDDFTRFEPLGNTVTSDMKFHQRRKERERLAKLEQEGQEQDDSATEVAPQDVTEDESAPLSEQPETAADSVETEDDTENGDSNEAVPLQLTKATPDENDEAGVVGSGKLRRKIHHPEGEKNT